MANTVDIKSGVTHVLEQIEVALKNRPEQVNYFSFSPHLRYQDDLYFISSGSRCSLLLWEN